MLFDFENLYIPEDYKFVRIMCVSDKNNAPNCVTNENCLPFRVRVLSLENNTGDYTSFDDDECKTFNTGGNYIIYANASTVTSVTDSIKNLNEIQSKLSQVETEIEQNVSDITNINSSLTTIDSKLTNHIGDSSHLTSEQISEINKIESLKEKIDDIYSVLNIKKETFTTLKEGLSSPDNQRTNAGMIVLSKTHFTSGIIKKISFPYHGGKGAEVYLAIQIIEENENVNVTKTFEQTIYSKDPVTQPSGTNGITTFEFENLYIPENYKAIRFGFVVNDTDVPQHNAANCLSGAASNSFRIKLLQNESNNNAWDTDECEVYTAPGYGYGNYVTHVEALVYNSALNPLYNHIKELETQINV